MAGATVTQLSVRVEWADLVDSFATQRANPSRGYLVCDRHGLLSEDCLDRVVCRGDRNWNGLECGGGEFRTRGSRGSSSPG